jgi:hypothetical protein
MTRLIALPARRRSINPTLRATGAAGLAVALLLSLAACKEDDGEGMTPALAALSASAPAVSATHVPPPPAIQQISIPATGASAATSPELAAVDAQLDATLGNASACSADTECHSVAVGGRACGGPTGYRAYSDKTVTTASVEALAEHERELAAQAVRASHQVSPCFMLADPGARCEQHKCVTGRPAPAG